MSSINPSEHNGRLHAIAGTGLGFVVLAMVLGGWMTTRREAIDCDVQPWRGTMRWKVPKCIDKGPALEDLEAIEASIAYSTPKPPEKQPQKKKQAPPPEAKPDSFDDDASRKPVDKPEEKKDEPVKKPDENLDDLYKKLQDRRQDEDDLEYGKPVDDPGTFDPDAPVGWATETKGDPYFQKLTADLRAGWKLPQIAKDDGVPVGCIRLEADGRISETLFKTRSGKDELDDSVERALDAIEKLRSDQPKLVPSHLLKYTTRWICFKFEPEA